MRVNAPTNQGWQNKSGALGSLGLGPEEEEHGRSATAIVHVTLETVAD
jgi:hypothetical protein